MSCNLIRYADDTTLFMCARTWAELVSSLKTVWCQSLAGLLLAF